MRGFFLKIFIVLITVAASAAPVTASLHAAEASLQLHIDAANPTRIVVSWDLPAFDLQETVCAGRPAVVIGLPGCALRREAGWPEVPTLTTTVALPAQGKVRVEILAVRERTLAVPPVVPSRGHLARNVDPGTVARRFGPFYGTDGVWPAAVADLGRPFLLGRSRGVTLRLQPLRYDAGRGELVVTEHIELAIVTEGDGGINTAPDAGPATDAMAAVGARVFANAATTAAKAFGTGTRPGRLLVIVPGEFRDAVAPLVAWKTRCGIEVEVATVKDLGGTAAAIAGAIADRWHTGGLDWVLLVGDREWVPTLAGTYDGSDSDVRYAMVAGDDLFPDLFVSRAPARSLADAATQVTKFVAYERDPRTGAAAAGYGRAAGIAGQEGTPADDERADLLRGDLLAAGFSGVDRLYERGGAGTADVRAALHEGRSLLNYLGHGTGTGWTSVPFSVDDVAALGNTDHWPWIVDVSCSNGEFARATCLAEAWLRAGSATAPAGAIAVVAASSLAPWTPPTAMQAEIVELLTAGGERSLGALHAAGLARVLDIYGGLPVATQVVEQFNLFGDASLQVRTRPAAVFGVAAPAAVLAGDDAFVVQVAGPAGAVVAVSRGDALYARGVVGADGRAAVTWLRPAPAGLVCDLTVTGPEMVPWCGEVAVRSGASPVPEAADASGPRLLGNHPNPFNPATAIAFELVQPGRVRLTVHDLAGRTLRVLADEVRPAGRHEVAWDGRDAAGRAVGSGVYLYRLATAAGMASGRMTLVK